MGSRCGVHVRGILWAPLVAAMALLMPSEAGAAECSPVIVNKACTVVVDREALVTPLPVRLWSEAPVIIRVPRRPLEEIQFDVTFVETLPADVLGAVFGQLITPIRSFVGSARLTPPPPPNGESIEDDLRAIHEDQKKLQKVLEAFDIDIKASAEKLKTFRKLPAGTWNGNHVREFRKEFSCRVQGQPAPEKSPCEPFEAENGHTPQPVGRQLPLGQLDVLDRRIKAALDKTAALEPEDREDLAPLVDDVVASQAALRASIAAVGTARTALIDAAKFVNDIDIAKVQNFQEHPIGGFSSRTSRTGTIKITAQDLLTKTTSNVATVVVHWGATHWEISTGAIFSSLPSRKFDNAQIIQDGKPQLDSAGKINTRVTETQTKPMIVPIVLVHYRLAEGVPSRLSQRFAVLLTGGIGVNPYSTTADLVGGATFAYRGLMISALAHRTRDLRLTNGLTVGAELGSAPPTLSSERFWSTTFALGITYRVAIN